MGKFNYIHKIKDGKHIYIFSNSSDETVSTTVFLRGKLQPEKWNPYNGQIRKVMSSGVVTINTEVYTKVKIKLPPVKSLFIVANQ